MNVFTISLLLPALGLTLLCGLVAGVYLGVTTAGRSSGVLLATLGLPIVVNMILLFPDLLDRHLPSVIVPFVVSVPILFIYGASLCVGLLFIAALRAR